MGFVPFRYSLFDFGPGKDIAKRERGGNPNARGAGLPQFIYSLIFVLIAIWIFY